MTTKDAVRALLDRLPENCSLDDVQCHLYVLQALARGEADVVEGRAVPHEQVKAEMRLSKGRSDLTKPEGAIEIGPHLLP